MKNNTNFSKKSMLLIVKNSKIHGKGVFAKTIIKQGTKLIEYDGEKITLKEGLRRDKIQKKQVKFYVFALNSKLCIDGTTGGIAKFINHSCNPNCKYSIKKGKIWIISLREIKKGEELTYDYEDSEKGKHLCNCRAKNCTGRM